MKYEETQAIIVAVIAQAEIASMSELTKNIPNIEPAKLAIALNELVNSRVVIEEMISTQAGRSVIYRLRDP